MDLSKVPLDVLMQAVSAAQPSPQPSFDLSGVPLDVLQAAVAAGSPRSNAAPTNPGTPEETVARERAELLFNDPRAFDAGRMGIARRAFQGATMGFGDEAIAALSTPIEMVKRRTLNPAEAYRYAKAQEDEALKEAQSRQGILGTAAEIAGSVGSGIGIARGVQAAPEAASRTGQLAQALMGGMRGPGNVASRVGTAAGSGALYGAVQGAGEGSGLDDRAQKALMGAGIGALAGGAVQGVGEVGKRTLGFVGASMNPEGYAQGQVARAVSESGRTPNQIAQEMADAAAAGQPYAVADALGNAGQRQLSVVARNPGAGRQQTVEFLEGRQAGQAGRVRDAIDDAMGATQTGKATSDDLIKWARDASDPFYEKALSQSPVFNERIGEFLNDPISRQGIARGLEIQRLESVARGQKFDPNDYVKMVKKDGGVEEMVPVPNMRTINVLKKGIDDIIEQYRDPTSGVLRLDERGRAINEFQRSFLKQIDEINPDYGMARSLYAGPAQIKDRIYQGGVAAERGRPGDNIRMFEDIADEPGKQGFRIGYADRLSGRAESGPETANAVRRLTSEKFKQEFPAFALPEKKNSFAAALGRERTMFETRNQAIGGSRTADNLSDNASVAVSPEIFSNLASGNFGAAARNILIRSGDYLGGNTPAVREQMAKVLLRTGKDGDLEAVLKKTIKSEEMRRQFMAALLRGAQSGGGGITADQLPARR
jgi:hypothetical protein